LQAHTQQAQRHADLPHSRGDVSIHVLLFRGDSSRPAPPRPQLVPENQSAGSRSGINPSESSRLTTPTAHEETGSSP
jgi:hypothetical protein